MTNKNAFLTFARNIRDQKHKYGMSLTIKRREGEGIITEFCSDPDYANRSGLTNSGVTFYHVPDTHEITDADFGKWANHLKDKTNFAAFLDALASQGGYFVALVGTKIYTLNARTLELSNVVYSI